MADIHGRRFSPEAGDLNSYRVFAFDLDGTALGPDHRFSPRMREALGQVRGAGLEPLILTGRDAPSVRHHLREAGLDSLAVTVNGAVVIDSREPQALEVRLAGRDEMQAALDYAQKTGMEPTLYTPEGMFLAQGSTLEKMLREFDDAGILRVVPWEEMPVGNATKITLAQDPAFHDEHDAEIRAQLPGVLRCHPMFFELGGTGCSKLTGLRSVLDRLGYTTQQVIGIGDSENDLDWLGAVGMPIAMGNAQDSIKAISQYIAPDNADDGAAVILEQVLAARGRS